MTEDKIDMIISETAIKKLRRLIKEGNWIQVLITCSVFLAVGWFANVNYTKLTNAALDNKQLIINNNKENQQLLIDNTNILRKSIDSIALVQKLNNKSNEDNFLDVRMDISKVMDIIVSQNKSYGVK